MTHSMPSLIETVRVLNGRAPLWHLHLRRLVGSCKALGVPFPGEFAVPGGGGDRVQRIVVGPRGKQVTEREVGPVHPVRLVTSRVVHQPYPHKVNERPQFAQAAAEAELVGADDGLLLTGEGQVAEASIWTVFWWDGDTLLAPPLSLGILPSVARMRIAELATVVERPVLRPVLDRASIFVANAARGIVPVGSLDGREVPTHPGTERLAKQFWNTVPGAPLSA
jgi:branched-subunit amino acid aminotransferase/4-amino-4-deoxychorismate lyase